MIAGVVILAAIAAVTWWSLLDLARHPEGVDVEPVYHRHADSSAAWPVEDWATVREAEETPGKRNLTQAAYVLARQIGDGVMQRLRRPGGVR